jgi:hypothetical protein
MEDWLRKEAEKKSSRRVRLCDPVGVQEIAERLELPANTVSKWLWRVNVQGLPNFPNADYVVSGRKAWEWETVEAWLEESGKALELAVRQRRRDHSEATPTPL